MNTFQGMNIVVNDVLSDIPKLSLSVDVEVSDEFRNKFNQWALDRFGVEDSIIMSNNDTIFMTQRALNKLKSQLAENFINGVTW